MRLEHDAAHRIVQRLLGIIEPCFRGEELHEFYREAMPIVVEGIQDYRICKSREEARLRGGHETARTVEQPRP